jgi:hypothetical protein
LRDSLVAGHAEQDRAGRDGQHHQQAMASPLGAPGVWDRHKAVRQRAHLIDVEYDLGASFEL